MSESVLARLQQTLVARLQADPQSSYVASLYEQGLDKILAKVGEEAVETLLAGKGGNDDELIHETADLWFHCMVLLANQGLDVQSVLDELEQRMGNSGLAEKAARSAQHD